MTTQELIKTLTDHIEFHRVSGDKDLADLLDKAARRLAELEEIIVEVGDK